MPTSYRVELAKTGRSVCKNTECKKAGVKIEKGELRFGNLAEILGNQTWTWKHWGCVTPFQIDKWWNEIAEQDIDLIDGYEELPEDEQERVKRSLKQGHVDDEDWKGDPEMNRDKNKNFRMPASMKKKIERDADEVADRTTPTPTAPKSKKRGRTVKEEEDDDDDQEAKASVPKTKSKAKSKAAAKKAKVEEEEEEEEPAEPPKKKSRTKSSAAVKEEDETPAKTKAKAKAKTPSSARGSSKKEDVPAAKRKTKAKKDEDPQPAAEPAPAKRSSRAKKPKAEEPASEPPKKTRGRPKRAAS